MLSGCVEKIFILKCLKILMIKTKLQVIFEAFVPSTSHKNIFYTNFQLNNHKSFFQLNETIFIHNLYQLTCTFSSYLKH